MRLRVISRLLVVAKGVNRVFDCHRGILYLWVVALASLYVCLGPLYCFGDSVFDSVVFEVRVDIAGDCPHAMLIAPINNSIVDTRDVTLIGYIYDNDDTIWFLTTTFYDYSTNTSITTLTSRTEFNISTVWTDRTPGETYKWYMYVENGTANYTSGVYYFTVSQDIVGTASDFYGTWLLLGIMLLLFVLAIVFKSVILAVAAMITSLFSTITYANTIMASGSIFDDTMLYIFIFITMAVFLDIIYLVFSKERRY